MRRSVFLALLAAGITAAGACSLINAPEAIKPGGGGAGGGGGSSSSGAMKCSVAADCKGLDDVCGVGVCVNSVCQKQADPAKEGTACDDGLFCTDPDTCQSGTCKGAPRACPTAQCHTPTCDEAAKMCVLAASDEGMPCDDGDPCTTGETCMTGKCNPAGDCSAQNTECKSFSCTPGVGCQAVNINEGMPCDQSNVCAVSQCVMGTCTPTSLFNGKACDDGLFCTDNDACNNAKCAGTPKVCPGANSCQLSACDEVSKTCSLMVVPDGMSCDDGDGCTFGTTCKGGVCTPAGTVSTCVNGDSCCPAGCSPNTDSDCPFWQPGVLQNVSPGALKNWSLCYQGTYADALDDATVDQILTQCNKGKLLIACKQNVAANYQLVAMGLRSDVLFDCGNNGSCTHIANGVGWYFSKGYSWGFANAGDAVSRSQCDVNAGPLRLCWHTLPGVGGYRCGDNTGLNSDSTWQRFVYQAP